MFNWGRTKKSVQDLEAEVLAANDNVVIERQQRIDAEIALSHRDATHEKQISEIRANNTIVVSNLQRQVSELESDLEDGIEAGVREATQQLEEQATRDRMITRKELRAEFGTELDTLKKSNASLITTSASNKGLYDGALLVIKSLETQLKTTNELNANLLKNLPTVSAEITTPSVTVGSNNKVS